MNSKSPRPAQSAFAPNAGFLQGQGGVRDTIRREANMQGITALAHVAIRSKDVERSVAFYAGRLGFTEMMRLNFDDGRLMLVYLRITDTMFLELFPDAEGDRAPGKMAVGINHFCLEVDDLEAVVARLAAADVPLTQPLKKGLDGNWQAWIEDPDGVRIELMQMMPDSAQAKALARLKAAGAI
jgi:lactoylglutathione lyase